MVAFDRFNIFAISSVVTTTLCIDQQVVHIGFKRPARTWCILRIEIGGTKYCKPILALAFGQYIASVHIASFSPYLKCIFALFHRIRQNFLQISFTLSAVVIKRNYLVNDSIDFPSSECQHALLNFHKQMHSIFH